MVNGAKYALEESYGKGKANDAHYDATCHPHMHPYDLLFIIFVDNRDSIWLHGPVSLLRTGDMARKCIVRAL